MEEDVVVPILIFAFGLGLIFFGISIGPQGGYYLFITNNVSSDELPNDADVVEYGKLDSRAQHAVRQALKKEDVTATPRYRFRSNQGGFPNDMPFRKFVHYQGRYYKIHGLHAESRAGGVHTFFKWGGGFLVVFSIFAAWQIHG